MDGRSPLSPRRTPRAHAAARAATLLVALVWLVGVFDRGAVEVPAAHWTLEPLQVDPWRDPPWRLRLIPGVGRIRAARLVAARTAPRSRVRDDAAPATPWRSLADVAARVDAGTRRALQAVSGADDPQRPPPVRLTFPPEAREPREAP
jgi:hypothetical protein